MKIRVAHKDECDDMMTDGEAPKKRKKEWMMQHEKNVQYSRNIRYVSIR